MKEQVRKMIEKDKENERIRREKKLCPHGNKIGECELCKKTDLYCHLNENSRREEKED